MPRSARGPRGVPTSWLSFGVLQASLAKPPGICAPIQTSGPTPALAPQPPARAAWVILGKASVLSDFRFPLWLCALLSQITAAAPPLALPELAVLGVWWGAQGILHIPTPRGHSSKGSVDPG